VQQQEEAADIFPDEMSSFPIIQDDDAQDAPVRHRPETVNISRMVRNPLYVAPSAAAATSSAEAKTRDAGPEGVKHKVGWMHFMLISLAC
jgi:hypothetical protein